VKLAGFAFGAAFGFLIAAAGVNRYDVIHRMLLLQEIDVYLIMGSAVAVAAPLLMLMQRGRVRTLLGGPLRVSRAPVQPGNVAGAAVFGSGWAIAGACPGPAIAMVAGGAIPGAAVMAGLFAGVLLRDAAVGQAATAGHSNAASPRTSHTAAGTTA
jgi:hypothetical protein